jgi:hypothetical protein
MPEGKLGGGRAHLRTRKPCSYEKRNPATQTLGGRPLSPEQKFSTGDLPGVQRLIASGSVSQVQIPSAKFPAGQHDTLTHTDRVAPILEQHPAREMVC